MSQDTFLVVLIFVLLKKVDYRLNENYQVWDYL